MWDSNPRTRRRAYGVQDRCNRRSANPPRRREEDSNLWALNAPPAFEAGAIAALPPLQTCPLATGGGESRTRTYEGRTAPSRFQRDAIAALPSHRGGATGTRTPISGMRHRRSPVER
jgi:hypothetical protein